MSRANSAEIDRGKVLWRILILLFVPGGLLVALVPGLIPMNSECKKWSQIAREQLETMPFENGDRIISDTSNYRHIDHRINLDNPQEIKKFIETGELSSQEQFNQLMGQIGDSLAPEVKRELLFQNLKQDQQKGTLLNEMSGLGYLLIPDFDFKTQDCEISINYQVFTPKSKVIMADALKMLIPPNQEACSQVRSFIDSPLDVRFSPLIVNPCIGNDQVMCQAFRNLSEDKQNYLRLIGKYDAWEDRCAKTTFFETGDYEIYGVKQMDIDFFTEVIANYLATHPGEYYKITCIGYTDEHPFNGETKYRGKGRFNDREIPIAFDDLDYPPIEHVDSNSLLSWARAYEGIIACREFLKKKEAPLDRISFYYEGAGIAEDTTVDELQRRVELLFTKR